VGGRQQVDACLPVPRGESRYLSYYCGDCWTLEGAKKFQNTGATAVQDRILLFTRPYSICYPYFYDLALTGQNAGASAIVAALKNNDLPVYLAPHLVPFASTIPFLAVQNTVGYVECVSIVHVGGTRGVTWSIDRIIQRHARVTWGVELIPRHCFFIFFLYVLTDIPKYDRSLLFNG
jgi:hypothetical protein